MKVFVHIANHYVMTDPSAVIVVECGGVPEIGNLFYISDEQREDLTKQIIKSGGYGDDWKYGIYNDCFSIDDAIYVYNVSWERDEQGVYQCHIELGDNSRFK